MNKQFRERLTGAVILVIFVVLVVPALLSGPPRPAVPAAEPASAGGPPLRSYTIDLTDPASAMSPTRTPAPAPAPAPVRDAQADASPDSAAGSAAVQAMPLAEAPEVPELRQEPAPASAAAPAPAPARTAPAVVASGFAVQIGSFANRGNADGLAERLRKGGFPAFIEPTTSGRKLYRVRVGPVADRAEAQILAARLATAGQPGSVVSHP